MTMTAGVSSISGMARNLAAAFDAAANEEQPGRRADYKTELKVFPAFSEITHSWLFTDVWGEFGRRRMFVRGHVLPVSRSRLHREPPACVYGGDPVDGGLAVQWDGWVAGDDFSRRSCIFVGTEDEILHEYVAHSLAYAGGGKWAEDRDKTGPYYEF